jgi:epoxyqueuosine reductase
MEICPTKAIVAPYIVDARLCISYLTIEHRGYIPRELRPLMGNRIFGCDDCQAVCPWNRHVQKQTIPPQPDILMPQKENILPELASLLQLDEDAFRERFRKSPVKRTGRAGLLRNVCIAVGNSGDVAFVPLLLEALRDTEALIRGHAAWALGRLCQQADAAEIIEALLAQSVQETDQNAIEEMNVSIEHIRKNYGTT